MKHKILSVLACTAIAFTFVFGASLTVHAADITFNVGTLSEAVATAALSDVNDRMPTFIEYDYVIYQTSSTEFIISIYNKAQFDNYIRFDNTLDSGDWDLDAVVIVYNASATYPRYNYKYLISNGNYVSSASYTSSGEATFSQTYYMYYSNMPLVERTYDSEYYPAVTNINRTTGFKGVYPVDPNWLLDAGVDPDYLWWQINLDVDYEMLEESKKQTTFAEMIACFFMPFDPACESGEPTDSPFYDISTFWGDLFDGIGSLFTGLLGFFITLASEGVSAVTGVFANIISFGSSIKTLFGYLPDPIDNIADLGIDISLGVGLLKLGRMIFLKV
jgi:hypothetical protein